MILKIVFMLALGIPIGSNRFNFSKNLQKSSDQNKGSFWQFYCGNPKFINHFGETKSLFLFFYLLILNILNRKAKKNVNHWKTKQRSLKTKE